MVGEGTGSSGGSGLKELEVISWRKKEPWAWKGHLQAARLEKERWRGDRGHLKAEAKKTMLKRPRPLCPQGTEQKAIPFSRAGPSVFPSREPGVSGDFWGSQEGCHLPEGASWVQGGQAEF